MAGVVALGQGVHRIPTAGDFINSFAFVEEDGSVTLVDAGTRFANKRIVAGLAQIGKHPRDVQRLVLTHAHLDHADPPRRWSNSRRPGASPCTSMMRSTSVAEAPCDGSRMMTVLNRLPGTGWTPCPVAATVQDGDVLDVAGGMSVHHTPGHTPGHISLIHQESGVLITGDSIFNMNARMTWPVKVFCTDFPLTKRTAAVLGDLDYRVAAFTHGP